MTDSRVPIGEHDSIQKYMLLSSQQEVLRRRLSLQIPTAAPLTSASPEFRSLSSSPASSSRPTYVSGWSAEPDYASSQPMSAYPIPTRPGVGHRNSLDEPQGEDSHKLCVINQQMKATLTELLNTESVRSDDKYRAWVQGRLMDTEHQIRKQRRRHSSGDREMADTIATHFSPMSPHRMSWR